MGQSRNYAKLIAKYDAKDDLTQDQHVCFSLFCGMLTKSLELDDQEKILVADFLAKLIDDKKLCAVLNALFEKKSNNDNAEMLAAAPYIFEIAYRARHIDKLADIYSKLFTEINNKLIKIKEGDELSEAEKNSLSDYAVLYDAAALSAIFEHLQKGGLQFQSIELNEEFKNCGNWVGDIELTIGTDNHTQRTLFQSYVKQTAREKTLNYFKLLTDLFVKHDLSSAPSHTTDKLFKK